MTQIFSSKSDTFCLWFECLFMWCFYNQWDFLERINTMINVGGVRRVRDMFPAPLAWPACFQPRAFVTHNLLHQEKSAQTLPGLYLWLDWNLDSNVRTWERFLCPFYKKQSPPFSLVILQSSYQLYLHSLTFFTIWNYIL